MTNYLEVKNLSKSFDSFQLHNITFTLPKGYIMGLIGPNGSGKTTTIKLILNMLKRNGGEIKIMGLDNIADEQKAKAELGVVFDTNYFSDDWKVSEVEKSISVFYPNWNSERFSEMLRKFHIAPTKKVKELSKGMQMKLMLAYRTSVFPFSKGNLWGSWARPVPVRLPYSTAFPPLIQSERDISIWMEPM